MGADAEQGAEGGVAVVAAVESKDELVEVGLEMVTAEAMKDAQSPAFKVREDAVGPRQDDVGGHSPNDTGDRRDKPLTGTLPLVSIGVPVFNGETYLACCLDSLSRQSFKNVEIIICDNASTDETENIARKFCHSDHRFRYNRNTKNIGVSANFNSAFCLSKGKYFKWASSDDVCSPTLVERCVEILEEDSECVLAYCQTSLIQSQGEYLQDYDDNLVVRFSKPSQRFSSVLNNIGLCNVHYGVMRSSVLSKTRLLENFIGSDIVLIAELSLYGTFRMVAERLFHRRMHDARVASADDYSPGRRRHNDWQTWQTIAGHVKSMYRSPLSFEEKMRVMHFIAKRAYWSRQSLVGESLCARRQVLF